MSRHGASGPTFGADTEQFDIEYKILGSKCSSGSPTALHRAAASGDIEQVRDLLLSDPSKTNVNVYYCHAPPAWSAIYHNHVEAARLILEAGGKFNVEPCFASACHVDHALILAIKNGSPEMVTLLLNHGVGPNEPYAGYPIYRAVSAIVDAENKNVDDEETFNEEHEEALHSSGDASNTSRREKLKFPYTDAITQMESRLSIIKLLLQAGSKVQVNNESYRAGDTASSITIEYGLDRVLELLVEADFDANGEFIDEYQVDPDSTMTFLQVACQKRYISTVKLLLQAGAAVQSTNSVDEDFLGRDFSALHCVFWSDNQTGTNNSEEMEKMAELTRLLLGHGADVEATTRTGWTVLHSAATNVDHGLASMKVLIASGADVNARSENNITPLHAVLLAAVLNNGGEEIVQFAKWEMPMKKDFPEKIARVVNYLITSGADVDAKTDDGYTPLDIARGRAFHEAAEALVMAGASESGNAWRRRTEPRRRTRRLYMERERGRGRGRGGGM